MIKCQDVIQLPTLKQLRIVAGADGLDRIVRWVHVLDMPDVVNWVRGGELLFMTGMSLKNPMDLLGIVQDIATKNLAGLVITPGKYISDIPSEVLSLADTLKFPVFELPWEIKLVEVFQEVTSYINQHQSCEKSMHDLLKNLIFGDIDDQELWIQRAAYEGLDLNEPSQVAIVDIRNMWIDLKTRGSNDHSFHENANDRNERVQQAVLDIVARYQINPLHLLWLESLILVLPVKKQSDAAMKNNLKIGDKIIDELRMLIPEFNVNIGFGNSQIGPNGIKKSFNQAQQALKLGPPSGMGSVFAYEQMGLHKLFVSVEKDILEAFYQDYVALLHEYDLEHGTDLIGDLEIFLQHNGNFGEAAQRLYIHRNTLIYRIKKIEELTGKSLNDFKNRIGFYIGIIIGRLFL